MLRTLTIVAGLLTCGCQHSKAPDPESMPVFAAYTVQGRTTGSAEVKLGRPLEMRMRSQAGTGFAWRVASGAGGDKPIVALQDRHIEPVQAKGKPVAGGEIWEVFTFRTLAEGTTDLEFIYDRPWEKDSPPEKRYLLKVSVIP